MKDPTLIKMLFTHTHLPENVKPAVSCCGIVRFCFLCRSLSRQPEHNTPFHLLPCNRIDPHVGCMYAASFLIFQHNAHNTKRMMKTARSSGRHILDALRRNAALPHSLLLQRTKLSASKKLWQSFLTSNGTERLWLWARSILVLSSISVMNISNCMLLLQFQKKG